MRAARPIALAVFVVGCSLGNDFDRFTFAASDGAARDSSLPGDAAPFDAGDLDAPAPPDGGDLDTGPPTGCPSPAAPAHGAVGLTSTEEIAIASYSCEDGYRLLGGQTSRCTSASGAWLGATPTCAPLIACVCGGTFHEGEAVSAIVASPSGSSVPLGTRGTAFTALSIAPPLGVLWSAWTGGHDGFCTTNPIACGTCTPDGTSVWYVGCEEVASLRLGCACGGVYTPGDRVVALVDAPSDLTTVVAGALGTVVAASATGALPILVDWDGVGAGHGGNCAIATCGACVESGALSRWWVLCEEIGRAP